MRHGCYCVCRLVLFCNLDYFNGLFVAWSGRYFMVFHLRIGPLKLDSLLFLAFIVWSQLENIRICWTIYCLNSLLPASERRQLVECGFIFCFCINIIVNEFLFFLSHSWATYSFIWILELYYFGYISWPNYSLQVVDGTHHVQIWKTLVKGTQVP